MTQTHRLTARSGAAAAAVAVAALFLGATLPAAGQNVDWRLHNLDLHGSRYAEIDQITPENVHQLEPRWLFQHGVIDGVSNQTTPIVIDGVMYLTDSRGSVYAVDAYDGHHLWTYDVTDLLGGGARRATSSATAVPPTRTASSTAPPDRSSSRSTRRRASR